MKLSEALAERADLQRRIQQILERAKLSATYQEGTKPVEDANALVAEHAELCERVQTLIQQINRTNSATLLTGDQTIADAIAVRDLLRIRAAAVREIADAAVPSSRYGKSEILMLSDIDVAALRKEADRLMKEHRAIDQAIQAANFTTELRD